MAQPQAAHRANRAPRSTRLRVGAADDPAERAAERAAEQVMATLRDEGATGQLARSTSRIRRSTAVSGAVGPEGGALTPGVEQRLHAARLGGRALHADVRAPMERAFGADFSRIRLHEGPEPAALNDELGAHAFTLGRDIFVRQPIDARRAADQHLLAHELAHTVQQGGSDQGLAARTIRRLVGFEFEVGSWRIEYIGQATAQQLQGTAPMDDTDIDDAQLTKDRVIDSGRGYNLKPDQADDETWHLEFVLEPPVPETSKGRSALEKTMRDIKAFNDRLLAERTSAYITRSNGNQVLWGRDLGLDEDRVLLTPNSKIEGEPQVTSGIRLDQLAPMMAKMASVALAGESAKDTTARTRGGYYLSGKNANDADLVAQSPGQVRNLFLTFPGKTLHSPDTPSKQLVSLLALIRTYLVKASSGAAYAKSIAPMMARTDFGAMYQLIPEAVYYRTYRDEFADLALHVSGLGGQGGQPFFSGASTYTAAADWLAIQNALSRTQWLRDIPVGRDLLTEKHFPDRNVAGYLFGFGKLEAKTDTVGKTKKTQTEAPVFELRRMIGFVDHRLWASLALELFDYFVALNRQQSPTFKATKTYAKHMAL